MPPGFFRLEPPLVLAYNWPGLGSGL